MGVKICAFPAIKVPTLTDPEANEIVQIRFMRPPKFVSVFFNPPPPPTHPHTFPIFTNLDTVVACVAVTRARPSRNDVHVHVRHLRGGAQGRHGGRGIQICPRARGHPQSHELQLARLTPGTRAHCAHDKACVWGSCRTDWPAAAPSCIAMFRADAEYWVCGRTSAVSRARRAHRARVRRGEPPPRCKPPARASTGNE